jgi:hypothetical protein
MQTSGTDLSAIVAKAQQGDAGAQRDLGTNRDGTLK